MNKPKTCFIIGVSFLFIMLNGNVSHSVEITSTDSVAITITDAGIVSEDLFQIHLKTLEIPSYTLADDFPQEHVKTFNDFLLFCASVEARWRPTQTETFYEHPLVKMRLEQNNPVQFEDFLAAIPLSLSMVGHREDLRRMFEHRSQINGHYVRMFIYPSRSSFLVENILEPLSHDLTNGEYRGYRSKNMVRFFQGFADHCYDKREEVFRSGPVLVGMRYPISIIIPKEVYLLNYYAQTLLLVYKEKLYEAYGELYRYKMPINRLSPSFPPTRLPYVYQPFPSRPYYYFSDEDRYLWFEFLQSELRSSGHIEFADSILKTEIEHYRELIVWQLQLRAYLTQKLYEYGDNLNLLTLRGLLTAEYDVLRNYSVLKPDFENAIEILRDIDDKVRASSPIDTSNGILVLPWIDREVIDHKQGIESEVLSVDPSPINWKIAMECIDEETKGEMKNSYEKAIYCIRTLTVINEKLYLENDLETMVQLHSKLANNKDVNCTPTGVFRKDFSSVKKLFGYKEDLPELDSQEELNPRRSHYDRDSHYRQLLRLYGISEDKMKEVDGDIEDSTESDSQAKFDIRRYDLIVNDFWGHQARRKNGELTVGEIILPWVEVPKD